MADELTLTLKASFAKSGTSITFPDADNQQLTVDVSGTRFVHHRQSVGTTEEALELGDIATGGWLFLFNRDTTNFVSLRSGTGATNLVRVNAGEWAAFRISSSATAPFVIADTAAVELECLLIAA